MISKHLRYFIQDVAGRFSKFSTFAHMERIQRRLWLVLPDSKVCQSLDINLVCNTTGNAVARYGQSNTLEKIRYKSLFKKKIRESVTASISPIVK
jgi:hypothetical protein